MEPRFSPSTLRTVQNFIYSYVVAIFLIVILVLNFQMAPGYFRVELTTPPSPLDVPQIFLKKGSGIDNALHLKESFTALPRPVFVNEYYIYKDKIDELYVISNVSPENIGQVSGRLYNSRGALLASWSSESFKPVSLEQAKAAIDKEDVQLAMGVALKNSTFVAPQDNFDALGLAAIVFSGIVAGIFTYALFHFFPFYRNQLLVLCQTLNRSLADKSSISAARLWLCCLAGMIAISTAAWFIFGLYYNTVDDPFMAQITSGYLLNHPDWHLYFMHPLVGFFLCSLYSIWPAWPVYSVFMIALNIGGLTTVVYAFLRRSFNFRRLLGCAILLTVLGLFLLTRIQFTMVSSSLAVGGILLILGTSGEKKISSLRLIGAIVLFLVGVVIRSQSAIFLLALAMPCGFCLYWNKSLPGAKRFLVAAVVGIMLLAYTERASYQLSPDWAEAKAYDNARGKLHATPIMRKYSENQGVFQAINWSPNDLNAFNIFLCSNHQVYSREKLTYLVQHLKEPSRNASQLCLDLVVGFLRLPVSVLLFALWLILAWALRLIPKLVILALAGTWFIGLSYLILYIRLPERVYAPVMFMELSIILLLADIHRPIYNLRKIVLYLLLLVSVHLPIMTYALSNLYDNTIYENARRDSTVSSLEYLSKIQYTPIIVDTISGTSAEQTYLWRNYPEIQGLNIFRQIYFDSPLFVQRSARFGINDVYFDLAHRHDMVFAVSRWDLRQVVYLEIFIHEHYGTQVAFQPAKIPGTDQDAVFPYFSIFKATLKP